MDPFTQQRLQFPMGNGLGGSFGQMNSNGNAVNFDFQCKCAAKSLSNNINVPTDSNAAAQQQIQQLNEQIRRLQEQLRRQQQGASAFEQFAQMLSMADGLDCNCSGSSSPFSNMYQGNQMQNGGMQNGMQGMQGMQNSAFGPMMSQPRFIPGLSGMPFQQRMSPSFVPQLQGPMFPVKS
uniref:Uncharacterized protein n=1 Tax=Panagrolaimus sp. ES5 TaxID=591445 RepID=A0AC34GRX5_9BILA